MTTIVEPHHAIYVTVVAGVAHRPGPSQNGQPHIAACATLTGPSLSYGWAKHLGATPCAESACFPPPGERLWMATRRRGLNHHRLRAEATKTDCDRFAGIEERGEYDNGLVITAAEAAELESKPCKQCWPVGRG